MVLKLKQDVTLKDKVLLPFSFYGIHAIKEHPMDDIDFKEAWDGVVKHIANVIEKLDELINFSRSERAELIRRYKNKSDMPDYGLGKYNRHEQNIGFNKSNKRVWVYLLKRIKEAYAKNSDTIELTLEYRIGDSFALNALIWQGLHDVAKIQQKFWDKQRESISGSLMTLRMSDYKPKEEDIHRLYYRMNLTFAKEWIWLNISRATYDMSVSFEEASIAEYFLDSDDYDDEVQEDLCQ